MNARKTDKFIPVEIGSFRWYVSREYSHMAERLARIMDHGSPPAAKASKVRKVFFVPGAHNEPALVLKEYTTAGIGAFLRTWVLGAPAQREWRALSHLRECGISVPRVVALGVSTRFSLHSRTCLALIRIEECCNVEEILLQQKPLPFPRKELAEKLGHLVRGMHDAGVLHKDLHAANLLVDSTGGVYVVDLHGAGIHSHLSFRKRAQDLISLAGAFLVHGKRTDRLRFFKAYNRGGEGTKHYKSSARKVEQMSRDRLFMFLEKFDSRSLRPGRSFQALEVHDLTGIAERSDRAGTLARVLGPYPHETLEEKGHLIHHTRETAVYRFEQLGERYVVKAYEKPGVTEGAKRLFMGSRGRQCWFNYHRLFFRGISVPRPILFLEEPPHSPSGRSFVVTEDQPDRLTLDRFIETADESAKAEVSRRLAEAVARMHTLFLSNRDMKAQNILIGPLHEVSFIDPDGVSSMREPSLYFMARDLMRINASFGRNSNVSLPDRIRFLKAYATHMQLARCWVRELWREILHLTWTKWNRWDQYKKHFS
ncbi:MAG: lipopolysaccharide kinase InaA family protein [Planctomycetota bacterium]